jgi:hypothetical protein
MNIFNTIRNIFRPKPEGSYTLPITGNLPPLETVTKALLTPGEAAHYLSLTGRQLSQWEMGQGPIRPTTEVIGQEVWVRFRTADVRRIAGA